MKSVVFLGKREVQLSEKTDPQPGEGEVRLKVLLAGLCATDRHIVEGHFSVAPPRILGHELVGLVDQVGPGVPESWIGKKVGVRPARFCGNCFMCQSGNPQLCLNFECLGNTHDGSYAEYTITKSDQLVILGKISALDAVWLEPLACVIQALNQVGAKETPGPILIIGAGTLGQLMLQTIRAASAAEAAVVDPNPSKIESAITNGAYTGWVVTRQGPAEEVAANLKRWAPQGIPIVIDTTGVPEAIERAVKWASPRGKILLFGVSDPEARLCISPQQVFSKELTLLASSGMTDASFDEAVDLLRKDHLKPSTLNAAQIILQDLPAYLLGEKSAPFGKVLIFPGELGTGE